MKLKHLFAGIQWVNVAAMVLQGANSLLNAVPALQTNPKVLLIQGLIAAVLPSLGGVAHRVAYGVPQDPEKAR